MCLFYLMNVSIDFSINLSYLMSKHWLTVAACGTFGQERKQLQSSTSSLLCANWLQLLRNCILIGLWISVASCANFYRDSILYCSCGNKKRKNFAVILNLLMRCTEKINVKVCCRFRKESPKMDKRFNLIQLT